MCDNNIEHRFYGTGELRQKYNIPYYRQYKVYYAVLTIFLDINISFLVCVTRILLN